MTSVLIVDDHAQVRAGLTMLLGGAEHMQVLAQAADGRQGVELARQLRPDVVLMDLSMPVLDGVTATQRIVQDTPGTKVVMLTSFTDRRRVARLSRPGRWATWSRTATRTRSSPPSAPQPAGSRQWMRG